MRIFLTAVLQNLTLSEAFKRKKFAGVNIEKKGSQIKALNNVQVTESVGKILHEGILNLPTVYVNREWTQDVNPHEEIMKIRAFTQYVLTALWLIKDNAVNSDLVICNSEDNEIFLINRAPLMFTNAKGEYENIQFTKEELLNAEEWFFKIFSNAVIEGESGGTEEAYRDHGSTFSVSVNSNKHIPYDKTNRLQRAVRFIIIARADSFLPAKITFYISALEALLSNSNSELKMQVADRSARILGSDYDTRIRIFDIVGIAYSFRSNYIHGSVSKVKLKFLESPEHLSEELDDILRHLIMHFLTDLDYVIHLSNEGFNKWIKELVYK